MKFKHPQSLAWSMHFSCLLEAEEDKHKSYVSLLFDVRGCTKCFYKTSAEDEECFSTGTSSQKARFDNNLALVCCLDTQTRKECRANIKWAALNHSRSML